MRITIDVENCILDLNKKGLTKNAIAEYLHCSRRTVFNVLNKYFVPSREIIQEKTNTSINDVISLRLLTNCNDYELLTKMFATTVYYSKVKKLTIPERVQKIVGGEKIKKIVDIATRAGLDLDVVYEKKIFA